MQGYGGKRRPAGLVFFEGQEKPRQYVIFNEARIRGQCGMEVFTTSSLQLEYPFIDKEQCDIYFDGGKWIYKNLSKDVYTFVGGKHLSAGEETELKDCTVIRLSNDRMLTAIFFTEFASCTDWQIINMDDGRHDVRIADMEGDDEKVAVSLQYQDSRWSISEIDTENVLLNGSEITETVPVQFDDCIQIGETKFIFEGSGLVYGYSTQTSGLSIRIDERSVHKALKKVTLPNGITSIGDRAFQACTSLTGASLPNSLTSLGRYAFADCTALLQASIPGSVHVIDYAAFQNCSAMVSLSIQEGVSHIDLFAFSGCSTISEVILGREK